MQFLYFILAIILLVVLLGPYILVGIAMLVIVVLWKITKSASMSESENIIVSNCAHEEYTSLSNEKNESPNVEYFEISRRQEEKIKAVTDALITMDTHLGYKITNRILSFSINYWRYRKDVIFSDLYDYLIEVAQKRCSSAKRNFVKRECSQVVQIIEMLKLEVPVDDIVCTILSGNNTKTAKIENSINVSILEKDVSAIQQVVSEKVENIRQNESVSVANVNIREEIFAFEEGSSSGSIDVSRNIVQPIIQIVSGLSTALPDIVNGLMANAMHREKEKDFEDVSYRECSDCELVIQPLHKLEEYYSIDKQYFDKTIPKKGMRKRRTVKSGLRTHDKSQGQLCRWITPNEIIEVQGIRLARGNFYVGECFLLPDYIILDNGVEYIYGSVLNPNLMVNNTECHNETFSSYNDMSPVWRYEYLMWLSGKRSASDVSTEILLFYLYGCEIRMFIDPLTQISERWMILLDILNLYETIDFECGRNNGRELQKKLCDFIVFAIYKYFPTKMEDNNIRKLLISRSTYQSYYMHYVVQRMAENKDYSFDNVFEYANHVYNIEQIVSPKYLSIARDYFTKDFIESSRNRYLTCGSMVDKQTQQICYYNSNGYFNSEKVYLFFEIDTLTNGIWGIEDIIRSCYYNLYSKFRNYNHVNEHSDYKETIAAIFLLPDTVNVIAIPKIQELISRIENEMQSGMYIVKSIDWLLELWEYEQKNDKSIHIEYVDSIIGGLRRIGYDIVPDYEIDRKRFNFGDICVIYRNENHLRVTPTAKYKQSVLFINLATQIVQADQAYDSDFAFVEQQLKDYNQTDGNLLHLSAFAKWRFASNKRLVDKQSLSIIDKMTSEERIIMCNTLMMLPYTDGRIHLKRIENLKKVLSLLGMKTDGIYSRVYNMFTDNKRFAVVEKKSDATEFSIKGKSLSNQQSVMPSVVIDSKRLQLIEQQTKTAHELLSDIFVDEEEEKPQNHVLDNTPKGWISILELLFKKEIWERTEVESICKERGLMLGAVLEQINDFSYEKLEDSVVEDDGINIYVTMNYKNELI